MPACRVCGREIELAGDAIHIGERDQLYHLSCAPDDLLEDAVTEGNAVLARGISYYVNKYLPDDLRLPTWPRAARGLPGDEELIVYADIFAKMLRAYRDERSRRR